VRLCLTKDDDMVMTGKRNPFENIYRMGFDNDGRILAWDVELYSDGGAYADLSTSIMERAMLHYWRTWEGIKGAFTVMNGNELSVGLEHKNEVITYKVASYDQLDSFFKQL
jgi:hypothetical protein